MKGFEKFINDKEIEMKSNEFCIIINKWRSEEGDRKELKHKSLMSSMRTELNALQSHGLWGGQNILPAKYKDKQGKERDCYLMNRDWILQMGAKESTYVRAKLVEYINVLESYIEETGQEEAFRIYRKNGKIIRRGLTDMIKLVYNNPEGIIYAKFTNLVYDITFGMSAKQLKDLKGLNKNQALRDYFTPDELDRILTLEDTIGAYLKLLSINEVSPCVMYNKVENMLKLLNK